MKLSPSTYANPRFQNVELGSAVVLPRVLVEGFHVLKGLAGMASQKKFIQGLG